MVGLVKEMGIQYFVEECRNFDEWQSFVDGSAFGNIFQTRIWAEALKEAGLKTLLIVARDTKGNIVGGMLTAYHLYSLLGLKIIPSISAVGGPLLSNVNDEQLIKMIFSFFDARAKSLGALHSFIRSFFPLDKVLVNKLNYVVEQDRLRCTVILDLAKSTEELWKSMTQRGRRGIRKAEKASVVVTEAKCLSDFYDFYQIHINTCKRLKTAPYSFQIFKYLWRNCSEGDHLKLFLAKYEKKTIAGCALLKWHDKMWYWCPASLSKYWHLNPNHLVQWHIIKWGVNNGVKIYDFLGIPCEGDDTHPKYGLYLFKTQFGGKIVHHGEYVMHYFPLRSAMFKKLLPIYVRFSALKGDR
jgi:hypothetical protein